MTMNMALRLVALVGVVAAISACNVTTRFERGPSSALAPHTHGHVTDPTGQGDTAEKFAIRPGDCFGADCSHNRERSERQQSTNLANNGSQKKYTVEVFFPADWTSIPPARTTVLRFQSPRHLGQAPWRLDVEEGLVLDGFYEAEDIEVIPADDLRGRWHRLEIFVKWHPTDGVLVARVNGKDMARIAGNTNGDQNAIRLVYGLQRSLLHRYVAAHATGRVPGQRVYFRNVTVENIPNIDLAKTFAIGRETAPKGCSSPAFAKLLPDTCDGTN